MTAAQAPFFEVGQRACDAEHWFGGDGRGVIDISVPLKVWLVTQGLVAQGQIPAVVVVVVTWVAGCAAVV